MEAALSLDRRVVVGRVGEPAVADDVVADDQAAGPGVLEGPGEVLGAVDLVGVDEGQVEGAGALPLQPRQQVQSGSDPQVDDVAEAGGGDVPGGDLGVAGLGLEGDQAAAVGQRPAQPDRAVAAQASRTRGSSLRPIVFASRYSSLPCGGETWITGSPASSLARRASSSASSWGARRPVTYSSTAVHLSAATGEVYQEACGGRKAGALPERAEMETAARRARRRERWLQRAERVSDAFGLVFVLVLVTYVLASLLDNRGWSSVVLTVATSATSVVALTSSHARARIVRVAIALSVLDRGACRDRSRLR